MKTIACQIVGQLLVGTVINILSACFIAGGTYLIGASQKALRLRRLLDEYAKHLEGEFRTSIEKRFMNVEDRKNEYRRQLKRIIREGEKMSEGIIRLNVETVTALRKLELSIDQIADDVAKALSYKERDVGNTTISDALGEVAALKGTVTWRCFLEWPAWFSRIRGRRGDDS